MQKRNELSQLADVVMIFHTVLQDILSNFAVVFFPDFNTDDLSSLELCWLPRVPLKTGISNR